MRLVNGIYFGGQPCSFAALRRLKKNGVGAILSIEPIYIAGEYIKETSGKMFGLEVINFGNWYGVHENFSKTSLERFFFLVALLKFKHPSEKIFVHCGVGFRTNALFDYYSAALGDHVKYFSETETKLAKRAFVKGCLLAARELNSVRAFSLARKEVSKAGLKINLRKVSKVSARTRRKPNKVGRHK